MSTKILSHSPTHQPPTHAPEKAKKPGVKPSPQSFELSISPSIAIRQPFYINAGVKFEDKIFDNSEDFVEKAAFRKAIASALISEAGILDVKWRETTGILELGPKINPCIPMDANVGLGASLDPGFEASGLLAYRYARAKPVYRKAPPQVLEPQKIYFPNSVEKALKMPLGSEIEIRGRGKLLGSLGASVNVGAGILGAARVGVELSAATGKSIAGEYGLSVTALGKEKVRVKISKINEDEARIGCAMRAGLLYLFTPVSLLGDNALKNFVANASRCQVENLVLNYASLLASYGKSSKNKDTTICCYDLDLTKPMAQEAYTQLLSLCSNHIDLLMELPDAGIEKISLHEKEKDQIEALDVQAFNKKLFLRELADIDTDGFVVNHDESRVYYCDKIYAEKFESIIYGTQEIRWESIELHEDNKESENYYRFFYEQCANIPNQEQVDKFFDLAGRLGIRVSGDIKSKLIDMSYLDMLRSSDDDTRTKIEVFFTQNGIAKLQDATREKASFAFQNANGSMPSTKYQEATSMLESYDKLNSHWYSWWSDSSLSEIAQAYARKFQRDFDHDYANFVKAKRFGELVSNFKNVTNNKESKNFFAMLGKEGFGYEEVLIALNALMGRENLLIHQLSLTGGKVNLESSDEGVMLHPREKAQNLFNRTHSRDLTA
jgi:hypothetical protein